MNCGIELEGLGVELAARPGRELADDSASVDPPRAGQDGVDEADEVADRAVDFDIEDVEQRKRSSRT